jgi:hypothetical protein
MQTERHCQKKHFDWKDAGRHSQGSEAHWTKPVRTTTNRLPDQAQWSRRVKEEYETRLRLARVLRWHSRPKTEVSRVEFQFHQLAERWKKETMHWSSLDRTLAHPSYLRIIGLASQSRDEILRLLLSELRTDPDHWFSALSAITGENPVLIEHDFDQATQAWLDWGRSKGLA